MRVRALVMFAVAVACATPAVAAIKWYSGADVDKGIEVAKVLGKPVAIMVQIDNSSCPLHNAQRARWRALSYLKHFVCVMVDVKQKGPAALTSLQRAGGAKAGRFVPQLFVGSADGEFLDVVPYNTTNSDTEKKLKAARQSYGPVPPRATALALWKKLKVARKLWAEDKIGPAMGRYQQVRAKARANPKLPVFKELQKDAKAINAKGQELIKKAKKMAEDGKLAEAQAYAAKLVKAFKGFEVAKGAQQALAELQKQD